MSEPTPDVGGQIPDDGESRFTEEDRQTWEELAESPLEDLSDAEITSKIRLSVKRRYDFPEWVLMFEYGAPGAEGSVCDCLAANTLPSRNYKVVGFEFKASRSDWLRELRDGQKADYFVRLADEFYLVAPKGVVEESEVPDGWGYLELKPNSEQLYKMQDSDLTEHQQGDPSRRFWVRFVKQTVGRQTNYSQEDLREARSRGYDEAKQEQMTDREIDRDLDRLKRKADNWEQLQESHVDFIPRYEFEEEDARTLELAYRLVRMVRTDGYGSIRGDLERLQTQIERTQESFLESTEEIVEGIDTLEERIEGGADPLPEAREEGGGADAE